MVNWKNQESIDRLLATIFAAHPSFKFDYQKMAVLFGEGATYDAIEGRCRRYRKMASDMRKQNQEGDDAPRARGSGASTPRTPRVSGRITKTTSSGKGRAKAQSNLTSPTRHGIATHSTAAAMNAMEVIILDGDTSDEEKDMTNDNINAIEGAAGNLWGQGGAASLVDSDMEIIQAPAPVQPVGALFPKLEERANSTGIDSLPAFGHIKGSDRTDQRFPSAAPADLWSRGGLTPDHVDMNADLFRSADPYFPANHAGFPSYHGLDFDDLDGTA